jgi:mono/diheme cytochrome c family protein
MNDRNEPENSHWLLRGLVGLVVVALSVAVYSTYEHSIAYEVGSGKDGPMTDASATTNGASSRGAKSAGRQLFVDNCGSCHTLTAAVTTGSGGPNLDQFAGGTEEALHAIESGGSGTGGMPANLVTGREAVQLANFLVSATGGKPKKVSLSKLIPKTKTIAVKLPPKPKPVSKNAPASSGAAGGKGAAPAGGGGGGGGGSGGAAKKLFVDSCGGCHTLKAAGTKGASAPPLDSFKGKKAAILAAIKNGGKSGGMPKNLLTGPKADQVAAFVAGG